MLFRVQRSSTPSGSSTSEWVCLAIAPPPPETLNMFCTATIGVRASACSISPGVDVAERQVADLALGLHREERVERLHERDAGGGHVAQVHDVEALEAQRAQVLLGALPQLLGAQRGRPALVGQALAAELGGDHQIARVGVQRLGDQPVGDERAVEPGGVDEVDAQLHRAAQDAARALRIVGLAPDVLAGQAHGAVAEALHLEIAEADGGGSVRVAVSASGFVHAPRMRRRRARALGDVGCVRPSRRARSSCA